MIRYYYTPVNNPRSSKRGRKIHNILFVTRMYVCRWLLRAAMRGLAVRSVRPNHRSRRTPGARAEQVPLTFCERTPQRRADSGTLKKEHQQDNSLYPKCQQEGSCPCLARRKGSSKSSHTYYWKKGNALKLQVLFVRLRVAWWPLAFLTSNPNGSVVALSSLCVTLPMTGSMHTTKR